MKSNSKKLRMLKNQVQGITLIALVVTMIILIILASVTINLTVGNNGLFKRAQNAVDTYGEVSEKEAISMILLGEAIDNNSETTSLGTTLYDRTQANGTNWHIISTNKGEKIYGTGWNYIAKGTFIEGIGNSEHAWLVKAKTGEIVQLQEGEYTELKYGMNLAVKDNLEFNLDPINMGDNAGNSWGNVILHGFNGTEYDEEGNVISGFSGTDFSFDGIDDYIELYTNNNFSDKGITIETYGHLSGSVGNNRFGERIGNIYKGPVEGAYNAFKYGVGNTRCFSEDSYDFMISGVFALVNNESKYACEHANNDFHIRLNDELYTGDAYTTFVLKNNGEFFVMMNGEKVAEDKFGEEYMKLYTETLNNPDYPIIVGRSATGDTPVNVKIKTYAIRIYSKALTEEESIENYNKTVEYHNLITKE